MAILHVRFGSMLNTATPAASKLICAAAEGAFERRTPEGVAITNSNYEGDWDADIEGEPAELAAHLVTRVWMDSSIEEDGGDEDAIEAEAQCSHNWLGGYCDLCGAIKKA